MVCLKASQLEVSEYNAASHHLQILKINSQN